MNATGAISILTTLLAASAYAGAAVEPTYNVVNDLSGYVSVIPVSTQTLSDIPAPVAAIYDKLPLGSIVIKNARPIPIMAITVIWTYYDAANHLMTRKYQCDGYIRLPSNPVVDGGSSTLMTPTGCVRAVNFAHLPTGDLIDPPLGNNTTLNDKSIMFVGVNVEVDAVVYKDGTVAGPDKQHYVDDIITRRTALLDITSILDRIDDAEGKETALTTIINDAAGSKDKSVQLRARWASMLKHSPNLDGTLAVIKRETLLPRFTYVSSLGGGSR